jgi:hypothetical protein
MLLFSLFRIDKKPRKTTMKKLTLLLIIYLSSLITIQAQQSTVFDSKSMMIPRYADLTAIQAAIASPQTGMMVYNIGTQTNWVYNGTAWINSAGAGASQWNNVGTGISYSVVGNGNVGIGEAIPLYKLDILHGGSTGIRLKSTTSFSALDIDAASGDAAIRLLNNGLLQWNIRNNPGTDDLQIFELGGGGERMRIENTTGKVVISNDADVVGTHTVGNLVTSTFKMSGNAAPGRVLTSNSNGLGVWLDLPNQSQWTTNGSNIHYSSGNVGIGNSIPNAPLQFANDTRNRKVVLYEGGNNDHQFYGLGVQNSTFRYQVPNTIDDHVFYAGVNSSTSNELFRIRGNGNVGIGTSSPTTAKLVIGGANGQEGIDLSSSDQYANMRVIRNSNFSVDKDMYIGFQSGANSSLHLFSNNNETMTVKNGNVGIGNTAPVIPLQFANTFGTKISLYQGTNGHVGIGVYGSELRLQNDVPSGKVSLGVIETNGAYTELAKAERNGAIAFSILGSLWVNGTTYTSDIRYKKNFQKIQNPLENLLKMNGLNYYWRINEFKSKGFSDEKQFGLIAQEVEKIYPELVSIDSDGYKSVNYNALIPVMIEAIKELKSENESLKSELNNRISKLEKLFEANSIEKKSADK